MTTVININYCFCAILLWVQSLDYSTDLCPLYKNPNTLAGLGSQLPHCQHDWPEHDHSSCLVIQACQVWGRSAMAASILCLCVTEMKSALSLCTLLRYMYQHLLCYVHVLALVTVYTPDLTSGLILSHQQQLFSKQARCMASIMQGGQQGFVIEYWCSTQPQLAVFNLEWWFSIQSSTCCVCTVSYQYEGLYLHYVHCPFVSS